MTLFQARKQNKSLKRQLATQQKLASLLRVNAELAFDVGELRRHNANAPAIVETYERDTIRPIG